MRVVPHDPACESTVIGAMFRDPVLIPDIRKMLGPADFYLPRNVQVFNAVSDVFMVTGDWDESLLASKLDYDIEACRAEIVTFTDACPFPSTWGHHAKIVKAKSKLRQLITICAEAAHLAYTEPEDFSGVVAQTFERMAQLARNDSQSDVVQLVDAADNVIAMMESGVPLNLRTGIPAFDEISGGVPKAGVWSIYAQPGSGKTTFALRACLNMARGMAASNGYAEQPKTVVRYCSVEQSPERAAATLLSQDTGRSVHELINRFRATEAQIAETVEARLGWGLPDFGFFKMAKDPNQLFAECLSLSTKHAHGILVMDYVQDTIPFDKFIDSTPKITEAMRILSRIARELGWLVITVSQLDKASGKINQAPKMNDGLGSSAIEQRSDVISYVWRPHSRETPPPYSRDTMTGEDDPTWAAWNARNKRVRIGVIKNKYGSGGVADLAYTGKSMRFEDPTYDISKHWPTIQE